jgi:membrane protease YdiL (CAAX protease family)
VGLGFAAAAIIALVDGNDVLGIFAANDATKLAWAIAAAVLIVAAAPLSEEIFFRGFMYAGLRRRLPIWAAALISGAVFGLLHYTDPDSIGVVPQLAVLGVLLAWLYERTGSLWPPILLHVVNNGIALAIVSST